MPYKSADQHRKHMREYMREKRDSKTTRPLRKPKPQVTEAKSYVIRRDLLLERLQAGLR